MADPVALNVEGLEPLIARMDNLSFDLRKKGGRFAMRKAANLIRDKAKENAAQLDDPKTAAAIAENVAIRFSPKEFKQTGNLIFRVGVMGGAGGRRSAEQLSGLPGQDTRHWRQQEFGNSRHAAQPFMRRALSENIQAATDEFINQYNKALDRAIKRGQR
ncbi:HK97-gp10 family putative phage morphogenesis protein [Vreelandella profundi]|uniref:HK97-gp10 family putative phage morphogenesis protein n=1 Tax=Vreelandella profundi TaxID=2852117 RepID=UPI001F268FDE|nr:HK97-gp10 family putative phage morphogenesis protein [Halomonas profundi]